MNTGAQTPDNVATKGELGRRKRSEIVKFRVGPEDIYLLKKIDEKLGFGNVSTTLRYLIGHYGDVEKAGLLVAAFEKKGVADAELAALLAERREQQ